MKEQTKKANIHNTKMGKWGEETALLFLQSQEYMILERNVYTPYGEIDLLVKRNDLLVFIEVKTRTSDQFGMPEDSITPKKMEHMINAAASYIQSHPEYDNAWQIDVITVEGSLGTPSPKITHFQNVV